VVQNGLRCGRFGFPYDILPQNIQKLQRAGIKIISVHGHTSSSDRAVNNYKVISDYMLRVCVEFSLNDIEYFDIGGGFFGAAPEGLDLTGRPRYEDYANTVVDCVENCSWFMSRKPYIVIEPGSSVVSNVFRYYTKVFQIKHIGTKNFAMVDGTVFDVKPTMHTNNLPHRVISRNEAGAEEIFDVVGSTCMEKDVILKDVTLKGLEAGDCLEINGVGAYTICLTPTFINYLSPIISIENNDMKVVRRRQQIEDILTIYEK
jgi:diaminopimelate decarboxylase